MGAYLSRPNTEKESEFGSNQWIKFGASSMQGWRRSQEDAHNCLLDFDQKRSAAYFAVYDGHGGSEVAKYCSMNLPNYIRNQPLYNADEINPQELLQKTFIDFDETLTSSKTKTELKSITNPDGVSSNGRQSDVDEAEDDADALEDIEALHDEANKPIESILQQYVEDNNLPDFIQNLLSKSKSNEGNVSSSQGHKEDEISLKAEFSPPENDHPSDSLLANNTNNPESPVPAMSVGTTDADLKTASPNLIDDADVILPGPSSSAKEFSGSLENDEDEAEDRDYVIGDEEEDDEDDEEEDDDEEDRSDDDEEEENNEEGNNDEEDEDDDEEMQYDAGQAFLANSLSYNEPGVDSGSTACVVLVLPEIDEINNRKRVCLYVANAGDSRAVLCRARAAVDLSVDHKPEDDLEKARIIAAGGEVTVDGRVNDGLNLSRAFGDHGYKCRKDLKLTEQMITAFPDVTCTELLPVHDEFVVVACDGIWNSMTSQEVVDFVYERLHPSSSKKNDATENGATEKSPENTLSSLEGEIKSSNSDTSTPEYLTEICKNIFEHCLATNTSGDGTGCDNMTCIIVVFDHLEELATYAAVRTTSKSLLPSSLVDSAADSQIEGSQRKRSESIATPTDPPSEICRDNNESSISSGDVQMSDSCLRPPKKPRTENKGPTLVASLVTPVNGCS